MFCHLAAYLGHWRIVYRLAHLCCDQAFFLRIPFIVLALVLSRSLPVASEIRGHTAGPPLPSPLRYVPSYLITRRTQHFLPSSTRVELWVRVRGSVCRPTQLRNLRQRRRHPTLACVHVCGLELRENIGQQQ